MLAGVGLQVLAQGDVRGASRMIGPSGLLLVLVLSALAVAASLHAWRTHEACGLVRFLAFESLALLIGWNARRWFSEPLSVSHLVSWSLLAGSTVLALHGSHLLRAVGRAQIRIIEDTRFLVQVGAYRYIRHPLYASLLVFGWGVFFKGSDLPSAVLAAAASVFLFLTARHEERFNIDRFGAAYSEYMRRTRMFVPFVL